jgi:hypothetical protein
MCFRDSIRQAKADVRHGAPCPTIPIPFGELEVGAEAVAKGSAIQGASRLLVLTMFHCAFLRLSFTYNSLSRSFRASVWRYSARNSSRSQELGAL